MATFADLKRQTEFSLPENPEKKYVKIGGGLAAEVGNAPGTPRNLKQVKAEAEVLIDDD